MHDTKVPIADAKNFSAAADCRMLLLCLKMHFAEKNRDFNNTQTILCYGIVAEIQRRTESMSRVSFRQGIAFIKDSSRHLYAVANRAH